MRAKFDLNIRIKEWHYFIVAYYNSDDKENSFSRELAEHCQKFDISILYFNPKTLKFFKRVNGQFKILPKIETSIISNLDYDFPESNPYNIINKNETDEILNSYYKQRIQKINTINFYKPQLLFIKYNEWLKKYNLNQKNIEESILRTLKVKKLNLVDYYYLDYDLNIPSPTKNNVFVFLGKSKDQVVIYFRKNKLQAINLMDENNFIHIINLVNYISLEEKYFFVFNF